MRWQDFDYEAWKTENEKFDHGAFDKKMEEVSKVKTLDDLLSVIPAERPPFKPNATYNKGGDMIEVYLSDRSYYAKWLCPGISVLLDSETDEVIGVEITGVKRLIQDITDRE